MTKEEAFAFAEWAGNEYGKWTYEPDDNEWNDHSIEPPYPTLTTEGLYELFKKETKRMENNIDFLLRGTTLEKIQWHRHPESNGVFSIVHSYDLKGELWASHTMGRGLEIAIRQDVATFVLKVPEEVKQLSLSDSPILRQEGVNLVLKHFLTISDEQLVESEEDFLNKIDI